MNSTQGEPIPDIAAIPSMLQAALDQIRFARQYTLTLLEATPQDRWFEIPAGMSSNIAWQVGHLAVSQYGLMMFRIRGREPSDLELIPGKFRKGYSRGSTPSADADGQLTAEALLERLHEVDRLSHQTLESVTPELLLDPIEMPYAAYPIKLGAILFCPMHEMLHSGQIGVIRRGLGLDPIR